MLLILKRSEIREKVGVVFLGIKIEVRNCW